MSLASESGSIRIPHAALFSSNPASRAIRALVLGALNPSLVAELLPDERHVAVLDILLLGMQDNADEQIRFAPLAGSLVRHLGSLSVPSASPRFLGALSCLRVVVAGLRSAVRPSLGATNAQELLQSSHGFLRRYLDAHRTSVDQSEPVEANVRTAFDVICDAIILACASIDAAAPGTLGSERDVLDCTLCLATLFSVDDDAVSSQISRALGACIQWLALAASTKAERGESRKPGGFSAETELTGALKSLHRGVLRELAAAALQMPAAASSAPPDQVQAAVDGATQRLVAALILCETLTEWLGGTWLVTASADHEDRNGSGSFLRALAGCIASEAKVRLEDVEFWLVLVDTAAAASPPAAADVAEPAQNSGRGMEYGPHDASAALANVQARLTAFPRRRRLQAAVDGYAGHAQVLSSAWRMLGSLVSILATLSDDEPPAVVTQTTASSARDQVPSSIAGLRAALRPDDLLALRGTLQDAASFALMSAASLWQSDLRVVLESRDPDSPPGDLRHAAVAAVSAAGLDVDSLAPRFEAAAPVVTGAARYAMTYLREDPGACEAEWAAALPCLARLDSTLVVSPEAWVTRVRSLLGGDATSPAAGSTAPAHSSAPKTRAGGGLGRLLSHLTVDMLEVLRLKVEVWEGTDALSDFCALPEASLLVTRGLAWLRRCARAFSLAAMAAEALSLDVLPGGGGGSDGAEAAAPEIAQLQKLQADEVADAVAPQLSDALAAALGVCAAVLDLLKAPPVRHGLTAAASPASPVASAVLDLAAFATRLVRYYAQPASPVQRRWAGLRGARPAALRCARKLLGLASELAVALQDAGKMPPPRPGRPDLQAAVAAAVAVVFER